MTLYTIGHSIMPMETFLALLADAGVRTLIDVRSSPYSRHAPHFSKGELATRLEREGIRYIFEGKALGGRPEDPTCYRKGELPPEGAEYLDEVNYAAVMRKPWFLEGIERVLIEAARQPTAVMCSEADPRQCHRHHLVATYIMRAHPSVEVTHIVEQGRFSARHFGSKADEPTVIQPSLF